ncbi:APC family permease [Empedobacter stercoris]|uniref:APC family permease n=1 Tax=Empedobacter stercoris TaxID=1628248 RepID=UPI0039E8FDD2
MQPKSKHKITTLTGIAIVVANMIGTGAFTSLGFQLKDLNNPSVVLTLWVLGGILALSGAFSYAEVGTVISKSGGEYAFLSKIYNPLIGYLSGWISLTVGFAAPIALAAIAFSEYFPFGNFNVKWMSIALVAVITLIHTRSLKLSAEFQNISTLLKVILIVIIISIGLVLPEHSGNDIVSSKGYFTELTSTAFAIALIYVSYSYSGWNAAAYITEEFENPLKSLPKALIGGTILVTVLYALLQYVFLKHVPVDYLAGQLNVGTIATQQMLGEKLGNFFGLAISLLLISGISAMVWVGPRVTSSIAKEHRLWSYFQTQENGIPKRALWLQFSISALLLLTGTFEQIMIYCGILLTASSLMTVLGVFKLRKQNQQRIGFKSPLFPLFQIVFVLLSVWMITYALIHNPFETILGMSNLLIGTGTYFWSEKIKKSNY